MPIVSGRRPRDLHGSPRLRKITVGRRRERGPKCPTTGKGRKLSWIATTPAVDIIGRSVTSGPCPTGDWCVPLRGRRLECAFHWIRNEEACGRERLAMDTNSVDAGGIRVRAFDRCAQTFRWQHPHQHCQSDDVPDASSYSFEPVDLPKGYEGATYPLAADLHKHPGLLLLGAVKHLPLPSEPVSPDGKSPGGWETIATVLSARGLRACSTSTVADDFELVPVADFSVGCVCSTEQREVPTSSISLGSQLCDRARHERSGVQLA